MTLDVGKVNDLIAIDGEIADLFFRAKMALASDDFETYNEARGEALKKLDTEADMKAALLG